MFRGLAGIVLLILLGLLVGCFWPAHAGPRSDWLEDAWSPETVNATGGPAVTLEADGSVIVVLPVATLRAARRAGLSTKDAVTRFLERWGQHCSDVLDLDQPHAGLHVALSLARPTSLRGLFVTDDEEDQLVIDYVPTRRAVCVTPGEAGPTS